MSTSAPSAEPLGAVDAAIERRFASSVAAVERFFAAHDDVVANACLEMARRFDAGGRLWVHGEGAQASDADHVAVEFVHPVIVGKAALPAISLATLPRPAVVEPRFHPDDMVMVLAVGAESDGAGDLLERARAGGQLTLALCGASARRPTADFVFQVDDEDPLVAQEVLETVYHVLWELVHVFLERRPA